MKSLYFTFFQTYLNYGNIAWCISSMTKVKKSCSKRTFNDIWRLVRFENREFDEKNRYSRHLQIKYLPQKNIMFRLKNNTILEAFENKFETEHHHYPTRDSENNFIEPKIHFKATTFAISLRGPHLWNSLTDKYTKAISSTPLFKRKLKNHLIKIKNITNFLLIDFVQYRTITSLSSLSHNFPRGLNTL